MSAGGVRRFGHVRVASALPEIASVKRTFQFGRLVPPPEEFRVSKSRPRCAQEQISRRPVVDRCPKSKAARTSRIADPLFEQNLNGTRSETEHAEQLLSD